MIPFTVKINTKKRVRIEKPRPGIFIHFDKKITEWSHTICAFLPERRVMGYRSEGHDDRDQRRGLACPLERIARVLLDQG